MNSNLNIRLNPIMLALGSRAVLVGGWGLYTMTTEIGHAPGFIGIISIAILELFAVGLAIYAIKVAQDGDSPSLQLAVQGVKGVLFGAACEAKTVATFLDEAQVGTRKISDQLGRTNVSMTQDRYLGRRLTDRQTADVLEGMFPVSDDVKDVSKLGHERP